MIENYFVRRSQYRLFKAPRILGYLVGFSEKRQNRFAQVTLFVVGIVK